MEMKYRTMTNYYNRNVGEITPTLGVPFTEYLDLPSAMIGAEQLIKLQSFGESVVVSVKTISGQYVVVDRVDKELEELSVEHAERAIVMGSVYQVDPTDQTLRRIDWAIETRRYDYCMVEQGVLCVDEATGKPEFIISEVDLQGEIACMH